MLCAMATRIQEGIRHSDTLARMGGDEFALILMNIKSKKDVIKILKKITLLIAKGFLIEKKLLQATVSIGISLYPKDGSNLLIEKADTAMYYVKKNGKNNFKWYDASLKLKHRKTD